MYMQKQEDTYFSAIDLHMQVQTTEAHTKFCQAGSQVGSETYSER